MRTFLLESAANSPEVPEREAGCPAMISALNRETAPRDSSRGRFCSKLRRVTISGIRFLEPEARRRVGRLRSREEVAGVRDSSSETALANAFLAGEREGVAFVREIVRKTVRHHQGKGIRHEDAEDLIQEGLLSVYRDLPQTRLRFTSGFAAYVRFHAHARCVDYIRRRVRSREVAVDLEANEPRSDGPPPENRIHARRQIEEVLTILESASPARRDLFRLRCLDGVPYSAIAAILGRSEGALRVQLHDLLTQIRKRVQPARAATSFETRRALPGSTPEMES